MSNRKRTKNLIQQSITFMIDAISKDAQQDSDPEKNLTRAECIRRLAEAYKLVD
jgi:hypothetical protein